MKFSDYKSTFPQETERTKYIAHSENGKGELQSMKQHCKGVANMMKSFALSDKFVDMYIYCGIIHDIGKYSDGFQKYIRIGGKNLMQNGERTCQ